MSIFFFILMAAWLVIAPFIFKGVLDCIGGAENAKYINRCHNVYFTGFVFFFACGAVSLFIVP